MAPYSGLLRLLRQQEIWRKAKSVGTYVIVRKRCSGALESEFVQRAFGSDGLEPRKTDAGAVALTGIIDVKVFDEGKIDNTVLTTRS